VTRTLSAAVQTEAAATANRIAVFVEMRFESGTVYLWSGVGSLTTSALGTLPAATWTGAGTLGSVSAVEETAGLRANGVTFTLSGVAASLLSIALGEHYQGRAAKMWLGYFDASWALIADPIPLVNGKMDQMELVDEGATATIRLSVENRLIDFERPADPGFYTDADQKRRFPGDRGLEYVAKLQNKTIFWGREKLKPGQGTGKGKFDDLGGDALIPGQDTIRSVTGGAGGGPFGRR
jgi:hypothetical protein